jgi:hypothetical protein
VSTPVELFVFRNVEERDDISSEASMSLNGDDSTFLSPIWSPKPKHVCTVGIQVSSHVQRGFFFYSRN